MRMPGKKIAILAAPLLFAAALVAQAPSAHAATTAYAIYTQFSDNFTGNCLADNGGSFLIASCPGIGAVATVNHAALWYLDPEGTDPNNGRTMYRLRNVHNSTQCITEASDAFSIIMATCGTNHVQFWEFIADPGGGFQDIFNVHFQNYLLDAGQPVWHFVRTSV